MSVPQTLAGGRWISSLLETTAAPLGQTKWWLFFSPRSAQVFIDTSYSNLNTDVIVAVPRSGGPIYEELEVLAQATLGHDGLAQGSLVINAQQGNPYFIAVKNAGPLANTLGDGLTDTFRLLVQEAPAQLPVSNDNFVNRRRIEGNSFSEEGQASARTADLLLEKANRLSFRDVWFKWTAPANGVVYLTGSGPAGGVVGLSVYTGNGLPDLQQEAHSLFENEFGAGVRMQVEAGHTYQISFDLFVTEGSGSFALQFPAPFFVLPHDRLDHAQAIQTGVIYEGDTTSASCEVGENPEKQLEWGGFQAANTDRSLWHSYTPPNDGRLRLLRFRLESRSSMKTLKLTLYQLPAGQGDLPATFATLSQVASQPATNQQSASIILRSGPGQPNLVKVGSDIYSQDYGAYALRVDELDPGTPFEAWMQGFPTVLATERNTDDDPDKDGITNLMELVTGRDPTVSDRFSDQYPPYDLTIEQTPFPFFMDNLEITAHINPGALELQGIGLPAPQPIQIVLQSSTDLQTWNDLPSVVHPFYQRIRAYVPLPIQTPWFVRLKVTDGR